MAIIEKSIKSNIDDLDIGITIVTPAKNRKVKSIIQLVCGINEDKKIYMPFMNFLARKGYVSVINDTSNGKIDNVYQVTKMIKDEFSDKKITLIGNAIGSLIVENYIQKYDAEIDKVIISSSISESNIFFWLIIVKILKLIKGKEYKNIKLNNFFLPKYFNNYVDIEDENSELNLTITQLENLLELHKNAYVSKKYKRNNKDLKLLILSGTEDSVIINEDKLYETYSFLKEIGYKTNYILYKDKVYDLLNNDFQDIINEDILDFIEE